MLFIAFFFNLILCFVGASIAKEKNRTGTEGFIWVFIFSVIGIIIVALLPTKIIEEKKTIVKVDEIKEAKKSPKSSSEKWLTEEELSELNKPKDSSNLGFWIIFIIVGLILTGLYLVRTPEKDINDKLITETFDESNNIADKKSIKTSDTNNAKKVVEVKKTNTSSSSNNKIKKPSSLEIEISRLLNSALANGLISGSIPYKQLKNELENEFKRKNTSDYLRIIFKPHTDDFWAKKDKFQGYYVKSDNKLKLIPISYFDLTSKSKEEEKRRAFLKKETKFKKIFKQLNEYKITDIGLDKLKTTLRSVVFYQDENDSPYVSAIVKRPKELSKLEDFEINGLVDLILVKENKEEQKIIGFWYVERDSPLKKHIEEQLEFILLTMKPYVSENNISYQRLHYIRSEIIENAGTVSNLVSVKPRNRRGKIGKEVYNNGFRYLELKFKNGKTILSNQLLKINDL